MIASKQLEGKRQPAITGDFENKQFELYDLTEDPGETTDIADKHPDVVKEMKAQLRQWVITLEASRLGEDY